MAYNIQDAGLNQIFNSSSTGPGNWYRIHPGIDHMGIQASLVGSSVGSTVSGVVNIEVSVDGVNPLATLAGAITISSAGSPGADGFDYAGGFQYIRANLQSISTGKMTVATSAKMRYP